MNPIITKAVRMTKAISMDVFPTFFSRLLTVQRFKFYDVNLFY